MHRTELTTAVDAHQAKTAEAASTVSTALLALAEALGFSPGAPRHIKPATLEIDRQVARQLRCASCRKRGLASQAFHRGQSYLMLACCPKCGTVEQL